MSDLIATIIYISGFAAFEVSGGSAWSSPLWPWYLGRALGRYAFKYGRKDVGE